MYSIAMAVFMAVSFAPLVLSIMRIITYRTYCLSMVVVCSVQFMIDKFMGNNSLADLQGGLVVVLLFFWWNSGGGNDTRRRLRSLAKKFTPVRRTAPVTS